MMALANTIITKIVSKSPVAIENIIKTVNAGFGFEDAGYQAESQNFAACTTTNDFKEGTKSFVEKRQPSFTGR
jgi:enoyl-CoA hydratase